MTTCGLGMTLFLAGCASLSPSPSTTPAQHAPSGSGFVLDGRFSLTQFARMQAEQRHSGRLHWKHTSGTTATSAANKILLSSPLGQGIAEIIQDAHGARLTTAEGKTFTAPDAETLTQEVLGYALPFSHLSDWVQAHSDAGGEARRDASGRLTHLRLDGWVVNYSYPDADPLALPRRIDVQRPEEFELRLVIDTWQHPPAEAAAP